MERNATLAPGRHASRGIVPAEKTRSLRQSFSEARGVVFRDRTNGSRFLQPCRKLAEEVTLPFIPFRAPFSEKPHKPRVAAACAIVSAALIACVVTLGGFAQLNQPPQRTPRPLISPDANRMPDANDQMGMRAKNAQRRSFDAANAERLKQLMQASEALETLAMALKAEVDKSEDLSQNTIHKAETIEKLA